MKRENYSILDRLFNLDRIFNMAIYCGAFIVSTIAISFISKPQYQSTPEEEVRKTALNYVEAFYEGDTAKLAASMSKNVHRYGCNKTGESKYTGESMSFKEVLDYSLSVKARRPFSNNTPKNVEILDMQNQTACAKLTVWWGTDYVLLVKENEKWVIRVDLWHSHPD